MADVPKFPGFPGQPGERWAFIKNIPSFFGGEDAEVDTSILPFDFSDLGRTLIETQPINDPFMPPDLTTVEPTDKYSQLERDWQNLQKIPEGTRDIFNRIVSEGEPASIWPVQELFPHIEPRSSSPIRSPFPPTNTTPTTRRMVRALNPNPLTVPTDGGPPRRIPSWRPFLKGGPLALGALALGWPSQLSEGEGIPFREEYYIDPEGNRIPTGKTEDILFTDEDSPFRQQLPHNVYQPQKEPGFFDRTRSFLSGLIPEAGASQAPSFRRTEGISLGRPFEGFWGADYPSPSRAFDITDDSLDKQITGNPLSQYYETLNLPRSEIPTVVRPEVTFNPPTTWGEGNILQRPRGPSQEQSLIGRLSDDWTSAGPGVTIPPYDVVESRENAEEWFENLPSVLSTPEEKFRILRDEMVKDIKKKPRESRTSFEEQEIVASEVARALTDAAKGKPVKEELQALTELAQIDPTIAERYTTPGRQELMDITSQVESFADIPAVKKVVKKKVKKVKPGPKKVKKVKKTSAQKALDTINKKALDEAKKATDAWKATQSRMHEETMKRLEEERRAKRYAGGTGGALMYT